MKKPIVSGIFLLLATLFFCLGVCEISFPDVFSWSETALISSRFPSAWKYTVYVGVVEVILGALLIIPAWKTDRVFAAKGLETLIRLGLGGMFITACLFKIQDPKNFATLVAQYQFLPVPLTNFFALIMPQFELWFGLALIFTPFTRESSFAILTMMFSFIIALTWALSLNLDITCGCFQLEGAQSKSEAWTTLIRDLVLLVPNMWLLTRKNRSLIGIWRH